MWNAQEDDFLLQADRQRGFARQKNSKFWQVDGLQNLPGPLLYSHEIQNTPPEDPNPSQNALYARL